MEIEVKQAELALQRREVIAEFERLMRGHEARVPVDVCPVKHHFSPGLYIREMFLPAGYCVAGKIHKYAHQNVITSGRVRVFTEQDGLLELVGPCTFVSKPYTKRLVYVLEDTVWSTMHHTNSTDLVEIESEVIATNYKELT